MNLIFLGPPGAGKGTLAADIKESFGIPHISTGELFRANVKEQSTLGKKIEELLKEGRLIPDRITIAMVKKRLKDPDISRGFILDGFPRTLPQAKALEEIIPITHVMNFQCPEEILIKRITGRRQCRTCSAIYHIQYSPPKKEGICDVDQGELYTREDDTLEAIQNRLNIYRAQTEPLIRWYRGKGLIRDINAAKKVKSAWIQVMRALAV